MKKNKEMTHWRTAQRLILEIKLEPTYWRESTNQIYDFFYKRKYSFSYLLKIISILNLWGKFWGQKLGLDYCSIPRPAGFERSRLLDAFFTKNEGGKCSEALTPDKYGTPILWIYQSKLTSMPPRYRWKLIPLFLNEQKKALQMIEEGNFKRRLTKTVKKYFGTNITLYGGRKGFTDLMLSKNQMIENICQWMGHSTIDRTWKH